MHHRIPFLLAHRACVRRFQMPLKELNFVKTSVTFGIIYATDPLLQNMTKIIIFASVNSPSIFLTINLVDRAQLFGTIFRNQYSFHTLYL